MPKPPCDKRRHAHLTKLVVSSVCAFLLACSTGLLACSTGKIDDPVPFRGASDPSHGGAGASGTAGTAGAAGGSAGSQAGAGGSSEPSCDVPTVGATPLERLTRDEYANSVRDLLGGSAPDITALAQDERVGPFAGNVATPVSDLVVEQYMNMAEGAVRAVMAKLPTLVSCDRTMLGDDACAQAFIKGFGLRVYRRPLVSAELDAYHALFTSYATDSYEDGLRVVTQTMLQSPNFLYRVELSPPPPSAAGGTTAALDAYELATRLSYFLTRSTPDDALLKAAAAGELSSEPGLRAQAKRLLEDARSGATLTSFHLQWLELEGLPDLTKDASVYPSFDPQLSAAMQQETERFVDYVVRKGDGKLETLLTAPFSLLDGPLYDLYGVKASASSDPDQPVQLDPAQRAGLLTQGSFLAVHAHTNQSAPVQRGKVVIRNVLCEALPDPPPNVNTTPPSPSPDATTRQRFAVHETQAGCAGCHVQIDGIGMGFESYDGIGAFRTKDGKQDVDATGKLTGTKDLDGTFDGAVDLAKKLAASQEVSDCVATQWLRFSLGRMETKQDRCALQDIQQTFDASGHDIRSLLEAIVVSDAFRSKLARAEASP